jgi:uncharacterized DUF497 family protein
MSQLEFEWDDANRAHLKRHRVPHEEFEQVIRNEAFDLDYFTESGEGRYKSVGITDKGRILIVVWIVRDHCCPKQDRLGQGSVENKGVAARKLDCPG